MGARSIKLIKYALNANLNKRNPMSNTTYIEEVLDSLVDDLRWYDLTDNDKSEIRDSFKSKLTQTIRDTEVKTAEKFLVLVDNDLLDNKPVIPAYYGTKHDSRERGELVATERLMNQIRFIANQIINTNQED